MGSDARSAVMLAWCSDGNKLVIALSLVADIQNVENNPCLFMDSDEMKNIWVIMMCVCVHVQVFFNMVGRPERQEEK